MSLQTSDTTDKKKAGMPPVTPKPAAATQEIVRRLQTKLAKYLDEDDLQRIGRACDFSIDAHHGQFRASGEPFVHHPMQVAMLMAEMRLDADTIIAGILHDVIEDTPATHTMLENEFGLAVANIVEGVSKIDFLERHHSKQEAQASSLQKMILAMTHDMRVIFVKLIDRLHNMRTLNSLSPARQKRIAKETLEIYAAIARRLGMDKMRREFENLSFQYLYPIRARVISEKLDRLISGNKKPLKQMRTNICNALDDAGIEYSLENRNKSAYSAYHKMRQKLVPFSVVTDIFGFRIIVSSVDDCYRAIGVLHNLYKPLPGKFEDYIAIPKENGYQSLHTILFGPHGIYVEVQIRTREMDEVAETGIAGHYLYKTGDSSPSTTLVKVREWIASLTELHEHTEDSQSFVAGVKLNLFPNEVYVFSPQGHIYELPRNATALDFAFAVHTGIGLTSQTARIDNQLRPLSTRLHSGQIVEIITSPEVEPHPNWLSFITTAKARTAVQYHLRKMRKEDAEKLGQRLLNEAIEKCGSATDDIKTNRRQQVLEHYQLKDMQHLYYVIGTGEYAPHLIAAQLLEKDTLKEGGTQTILLDDTSGLSISYGHCCYPVPGDSVVGVLRPGQGLTIHRKRCPNITGKKHHGMQILPVQWPDRMDEQDEHKHNEYLTAIRVEASHKRGVLAVIAGRIAEAKSNIEHVAFEGEGGPIARLLFILSVKDRAHIEKVIRCIRRSLKEVKVTRVGSMRDNVV